MKKTYSIPQTKTVKIETAKMIAGSLDIENGTGSVYETQVGRGTEAESRFRLWDNDDLD